MTWREVLFAFGLFAASAIATGALAQTTGALSGTATADGAPLPGVSVTLASGALQGARTTLTGANGGYAFVSLPPGKYHVTFELDGMQAVTKSADIRLAETARVDARLEVGQVRESITVTASAASVLETPQVTTSLTREAVEALPVDRGIARRIQLAPGVSGSGVNNQTVINGSFSYDNLYLVNGVVVNDTLRGQPEDLFIEDAIQETTVLTGGVSAQYGRFSGGVVNTITKSGGNDYSGSLRDNLTNPSWTRETDFRDPVTGVRQPKNAGVTNHQYEATLGGFILKDRLWFFTAARKFDEAVAATTTQTNIPYINERDNRRAEVKLSAHLGEHYDAVGSYLANDTTETNSVFGTAVDLRVLSDRKIPNRIGTLHFSGVPVANVLVEAAWSRREYSIAGWGGPRDLINGTMLVDNSSSAAQAIGAGRRMWAPTYCGACDPRVRNNKDYLAKVSWFVPTRRFGSHTLAAGYDEFHDLRRENNYKSGSDYRLLGDFVYDGPNVYFHLGPKGGQIEWDPLFELSQTGDVATKSLFVDDKWEVSNRWTLTLGARHDRNHALDQSRNKVSGAAALSPRLGAIFDLRGNGVDRFSATYAKYVSKLDVTIADWTARGGQPALIVFNYRGPDLGGTNTADVIRAAFDWFNSVGGTSGYKDIDSITVPGLSERLAQPLQSPYLTEATFGYARQLGTGGSVRADVIRRRWRNFYTIRRDTTTGQDVTPIGTKVDVGLIENSDEGLSRRYDGVQLRSNWHAGRLSLGASYTWSQLRGNVEGETYNRATGFSGNREYPEYKSFAQNQPIGWLNEDVRHLAVLFARYEVASPAGTLSFGLLERYHSGSPFSAAGAIDSRGFTNPNGSYATPPSSVTYYFAPRGAFRLDDIHATDVTASLTLPGPARSSLFLRADLLNVFNRQGVEFAATSIGPVVETRVYTRRQAARSSDGLATLQPFDPHTTTPVRYVPGQSDPGAGPYHYELDPHFGQATNKEAYQTPRMVRFALGLRF
jgi:hypothetical protein